MIDHAQRFCIAYLVVWLLSPVLAFGDVFQVGAVLAAITWVAIESTRKQGVILTPSPPVLLVAGFLAYTVLVEFVVDGVGELSRHFQLWIVLFFVLVHESDIRRGNANLRFLFWLALIVMPIWLLTTLNAYDEIASNVSRILTRSSAYARELSEQGVGGFSTVYSAALAIPVLAYLVFWPKQVDWKVICGRFHRWWFAVWILFALNLLLSVSVVVRAGYSIAIVLTVLALFVLVAVGSRGLAGSLRALAIGLVIAVLIAVTLRPTLDFVADLAVDTSYEVKIRDIRTSLSMDQAVGTVSMRAERYTRSISLFFANPVLGTLTYDDVGKHSEVLDKFAQYGTIVGVAFLYLILFVPLRMLRGATMDAGPAFAILFLVIGLSLLNRVFGAFGFMLFVFYPAAMSFLKSQRPTGPAFGNAN